MSGWKHWQDVVDIVSGHLGQRIACIKQHHTPCHGSCFLSCYICTIMLWPIGFQITQKKNLCHFYQCDIYIPFHETHNIEVNSNTMFYTKIIS